jgi:hypothetical protein
VVPTDAEKRKKKQQKLCSEVVDTPNRTKMMAKSLFFFGVTTSSEVYHRVVDLLF